MIPWQWREQDEVGECKELVKAEDNRGGMIHMSL
jgi:hypothetical protein